MGVCVCVCVWSGRYWEMVERLRINQLYAAPTALRLLLKYDENWVKKYDRSSLRTLGSGTINTHTEQCVWVCVCVWV